MEYKVKRIGNGWYSFKDIPQGYIKIDGLRCETDRKALNRAKRMIKLEDTAIIEG